jgi:nanoRNase/pAp phosphatase (c-di-AMP/oligoRNAs hydrolase)
MGCEEEKQMHRRQKLASARVSPRRLDLLRQTAGSGPLLILTHDNPDPDALAAGKALATLFERAWNIPSKLAYSGLVARAENKAMLQLLTPEWQQVETLDDWPQYSAIALVDTQPGGGNNSLPSAATPQIVIDHHQRASAEINKVQWVDIRTDIGATVCIIYLYLEAVGIEPDAQLATAIFYGIQTDTRGLTRSTSPIDQEIYFKMLPLLDRKKLVEVENAGVPREYFRTFVKGLQSAQVFGNVVVSYLGEMHRPDFTAELADALVRLENTQAALCLGYHDAKMYLSLRTVSNLDAGTLIRKVIMATGRAGGHGMTAGGRVPLEGESPDALANEIIKRFLEVMANLGGLPESLI